MKKLTLCRAALGVLVAAIGSNAAPCHAQAAGEEALVQEVPQDFPRFSVPGREASMENLRALFWLHYAPATSAARVPTLYDEWMTAPSLWPAVQTRDLGATLRESWKQRLSTRIIDEDGYVASHQHISMAHPLGWPLPPGHWGSRGKQWHFSFQGAIGPPYRADALSAPSAWTLRGAHDGGLQSDGWRLVLRAPDATLEAPPANIEAFQAPFLMLIWRATGLGKARPYIEWTTADALEWSSARRVYFPSVESASGARQIHNEGVEVSFSPIKRDTLVYQPIAMYRHPLWRGEISRVRVGFGNREAAGEVVVQALVTSFDTRHNINNMAFISGCASYFNWTGDTRFLRANIVRMRRALRYVQSEFSTLKNGYVTTPWVGHDGRSGLARNVDGTSKPLPGRGIGSNYWDLLPFGGKDAYATILYYGALRRMITLEREIAQHPQWQVSQVLAFSPQQLEKHAEHVKAIGNRVFWNAATKRFVANIDSNGKSHDFGYTFVNLEAIHYGFATPQHARQIMSWIEGKRTVAGDTSQGADIYHWRFAPRASTKRNLDDYTFWWNKPEETPWGAQVQDGGAVLAFSYHDMMARLRVLGPDNAAARLNHIADWFGEVRAAGGYRKFYDAARGDKRPGVIDATLQGGGTAGGLGLDNEFIESALVTQVMLDGFMGFAPRADGFSFQPQLPHDWPQLSINHVFWHGLALRLHAAPGVLAVSRESGATDETCWIRLPRGRWHATTGREAVTRRGDGAFGVRWNRTNQVRFEKVK